MSQSATTYRLVYFPTKGRAEPIRMMFTYAGMKFEDVRIPIQRWIIEKASNGSKGSKLPFGQLPVLYVNGNALAQSQAIARFVGRELGLIPQFAWEQAFLDSLVDLSNDISQNLTDAFKQQGNEAKMIAVQNVANTKIKPSLALYENLLKTSETGYFGSSEVTWADFVLYSGFKGIEEITGIKLDNYKAVSLFCSKIETLPRVDVWIQNNRKVPFSLYKA